MKQIKLNRILIFSELIYIICVASPTGAQSKNKSSSNFSFAYITDSHLEYESKNRQYGRSLQYFDNAVIKINKLKPDFIMTGGDNLSDVTKARESAADSLFNFYLFKIKGFNSPVYSGIGNHESFGVNNPGVSPGNPLYGKKMYEKKIGERYYSFSYKGWKFFMVDDIRNTETGSRYAAVVDDDQMQWLGKELATTDTLTPIVICTHTPLLFLNGMEPVRPKNPRIVSISNFTEFMKLFDRHNLKVILQGHCHYYEVFSAENIHFITGPALQSPAWGNENMKESGFLLFNVKGDNISWEFYENNL